MQNILKISDASVIAIHAINYMLTKDQNIYSASKIAEDLSVSYNHLSKILQLLVKYRYLKTTRGPSGGYALTTKGKNAKIKEIIELIDGPVSNDFCLMKKKTCEKKDCTFTSFIKNTVKEYEKVISKKISDI